MVKSLNEIDSISSYIKDKLPLGGIILLVGNLASGKTTLVKNFVKMAGIKEEVTSPTFSILNIYEGQVYHYDIYSEGSAKFLQSGLLENLELPGYHFIEWADESLAKLIKTLGFDFMKIEIKASGEKRVYGMSYEA